uniref:Uncharacterized protein n=1 Tax=Timema tahoe TaxID=61484 RepID=A0A7R9II27_9NEOP|nr:unnamed protein product [Timema tahoe]
MKTWKDYVKELLEGTEINICGEMRGTVVTEEEVDELHMQDLEIANKCHVDPWPVTLSTPRHARARGNVQMNLQSLVKEWTETPPGELYKASHNISYTWQPDILLARWMRTGPVTIVLFDWSETLPPHSQHQCSLEQGLFKHDPVKARGRLVVELGEYNVQDRSVKVYQHLWGGRVENHFGKTTLSTPSQDLNPDLPVIANTRVTPKTMRPCLLFTIKNRVHGTSDPRHRGLQTLAIDVEVELHMVEVVLQVSHSLLISSDRMKPRSGDWAVTIYFLQEAAITAPSSSSCPFMKESEANSRKIEELESKAWCTDSIALIKLTRLLQLHLEVGLALNERRTSQRTSTPTHPHAILHNHHLVTCAQIMHESFSSEYENYHDQIRMVSFLQTKVVRGLVSIQGLNAWRLLGRVTWANGDKRVHNNLVRRYVSETERLYPALPVAATQSIV